MKKRIFAILLALVMLLGALPVTAMAADDVSRVVKSAFTTWDTYERALVLTNNIAEPVYATVVVKPGETITDFGNLVFFTTGGHALSSGFSNTLRWNYTPDVVDLNVVEDGGTLRVSFTGKQEGTAKVKLNYWTSYYFPDTQTGSGTTAHCSGDIYYNLIVSNDPVDLDKKPEKPGKDVLDTLHDDDYNCAVYLECYDSDNYRNNNYHDQGFSTIASVNAPDSYVVSDVFANDGTHDTTDTTKYPWMCEVTVYGQPFVDYYNNVLKGTTKGIHYLKNTTSQAFYLYYNATTGNWAYAIDFPLYFRITKTEKNMQDITLSYDGGDHTTTQVTGIPASETKRVNTGAKAKFTVSSDVPTCGCGKDCTFLGWKLDGDTKLYVGGDAIELDANATLRAQWREDTGGGENPDPGPGPSTERPEKPDPSGFGGDVFEDYGDGTGKTWKDIAVYMSCATASHVALYKDITRFSSTYTLGDVIANDGTHTGYDTANYPWMCAMTVSADKWLEQYHKDYKTEVGEHTLADNEPATQTVYWFYSSTGGWTYNPTDAPIKINIKHQDPEPEVTYTVKYLEKDTNAVLLTEKTGKGKHNATVMETYVQIGGYTCVSPSSQTITLDKDGTNEIIFYYTKDLTGLEDQLKGKNVIVECVTTSGKHEKKSYTVAQGLPSDISTAVTKNGANYTLTLSSQTFVGLYNTEIGTEHTLVTTPQQPTSLTWEFHWDATEGKWVFTDEVPRRLEVEHTVTEPTTPPSTEELRPLLGKVEVDCVDRTVEHDTLEYDAVDGLVEGSLQKVAGGYQTGSGQHYDTAYTCTLSGAKFAQLYSGETTDTPAGSGVAHTLKTPETIACTVYWNPIEGKWVATKETAVIQTTHAEYTVTFKYQVNGYSDKTQTVVAGSTVTKPADERREGYTLEGWYETADCTGEKFNFSTPINANKILYAKWTAKQVPYTIRHRDKDTNETVAPDTTGTGAYGEKITLTPKADIADYVPAEGNPQYSWLTSEVGNIFTLRYVKLFTVSFDCHMDGMTIAAKTVQRNAKVTSPGTLTRTGYVFGGWYKNLSDAAAYDFDTPVTESFTLHAKWTPRTDIPYTVKYLEEGTNKELHAAKTGTGTFNTTVQVTAEAISGYTLVGSSPRDLKLENVFSNELIFYYTKDPVKVSYTVHYYEQGTTTKVAADKVVNNVNAGTEVTEDAISVTGYTAAAPTQQKLNLSATGTNEIIFYYTKNAGTQVGYTVRYLKEGTGEALRPDYANAGTVGGTVTVTAPAIDGYTCVTTSPQTITLNANAALNVITFYYRENGGDGKINTGEPASDPFNNNVNPRQLNRDDHFAYIKGYPDGTVRPEASLTRAEAAAILYRVMEKSCVERFHAESSSFRDVPDGKWYTTYVATLEKAGVIVDSKDGNFRPNDAITRAELASMLAQFANVTGGTNTFSDVSATHWAADYIAAAVRSGWIQGYPDGTFRPEQTIKRAEMTAMVNRALGRDPQSASDLLEGMKTWKDNADPTAWFYLDIQEAANGHTFARKTSGEYWTGLLADVVK